MIWNFSRLTFSGFVFLSSMNNHYWILKSDLDIRIFAAWEIFSQGFESVFLLIKGGQNWPISFSLSLYCYISLSLSLTSSLSLQHTHIQLHAHTHARNYSLCLYLSLCLLVPVSTYRCLSLALSPLPHTHSHTLAHKHKLFLNFFVTFNSWSRKEIFTPGLNCHFLVKNSGNNFSPVNYMKHNWEFFLIIKIFRLM